MIYSIDYFQFDFCLGALNCTIENALYFSLDQELIKLYGQMEVDHGIKHFAKYDLRWWQFGHFHVEVWPKSFVRDISCFRSFLDDEEECEASKPVFVSEKYSFMRFAFNPNQCKDNSALQDILAFLTSCGWMQSFCITRIDYALDVKGLLSDFYVLSRKSETNYGTTRYYGVRGTSGYLRVYDKRKEQLDKERYDIGYDLVRFEWEQRGSRDLDFTFDSFSRMDFTDLKGSSVCLQYVPPELINQALLCFSVNQRTKLRKQLFSPIEVKKEIFARLVEEYISLFGLRGWRTFTTAQLFEMEDGSFCPVVT